MPPRAFILPNGRACRPAVYCAAWRALLAMPPDAQVAGFGHFPEPAARILADLRRGMHDRINAHLAGYGTGRKWSQTWQTEAMRTAQAVNTPRLRITWLPADFRSRFAHRLAD